MTTARVIAVDSSEVGHLIGHLIGYAAGHDLPWLADDRRLREVDRSN
jgi:hypothetical protein